MWAFQVAHVCFCHFKCNYTHYSLSSCIGLHVSLPTLYTCEVLFYLHMHMLAVICVITTCTSIDYLPQLDQVMHAALYKCFDHKRGLLLIATAYNWSINFSGWCVSWSVYVRLYLTGFKYECAKEL